MSQLLHAKRALERRLGGRVTLRRHNLDGVGPVEVHAAEPLVEWQGPTRVESTLIGTGDDHLDAIAAAHDLLASLDRVAADECRGDYLHERAVERDLRGDS